MGPATIAITLSVLLVTACAGAPELAALRCMWPQRGIPPLASSTHWLRPVRTPRHGTSTARRPCTRPGRTRIPPSPELCCDPGLTRSPATITAGSPTRPAATTGIRRPSRGWRFSPTSSGVWTGGAPVLARDDDGNTILHHAAANADGAVAALLQQTGADVNARNGDGTTPLHRGPPEPGIWPP